VATATRRPASALQASLTDASSTQATAALFERHHGRLGTCLASFEQVALNAALRVPPGLTLASGPVQPVRSSHLTARTLKIP